VCESSAERRRLRARWLYAQKIGRPVDPRHSEATRAGLARARGPIAAE
jgi:hypothetical protein